eukprot:gene33131-44351_t
MGKEKIAEGGGAARRRGDLERGDVGDDGDADFAATVVERLGVLGVVEKLGGVGEGEIGQRRADEDRRIVFGDEPEHVALGADFLRVVAGTEGQSAELTLSVDDVEKKAEASGDGPVDAVFNAIHEIVPHAAALRLFQVHAVTEGTDAQAQVSVRLEEDGRIATGQAADTDTLTASAKAYVNALNNLFSRKEKGKPDTPASMLWIPITVAAAGFQVARNAAQRSLLTGAGPWGATLVRFLFGLPFSLVFSGIALLLMPSDLRVTPVTLAWAALGGTMQLGATAALLTAMQRSSFALGTAFQQSGLPFAAILGLLLFGDHLSLRGWGGVLLASAGLHGLDGRPSGACEGCHRLQFARAQARGPLVSHGLRAGDEEVRAMILINLLPHREARRAERKRTFFVALGFAALIGVALAMLWYGVLQQLTSSQESRNGFLSTEIAKLEAQIKDIATLRAEIDALKARQKAVEDLQTDRNVPVYLLNELVKQTPEGVYLTSIRQTDNVVTMTGLSQTNERVSELLRNTAYNSAWLERPELVEIKVAAAKAGGDPRRLFDFSLRVSIKRPQVPASAASGPGRAASGALPARKSPNAT